MPTERLGAPAGAPRTEIHWTGNDIFLHQYQTDEDIKAILAEVKEFDNRPAGEKNTKHGTRFAGYVPLTVHYQWIKEWEEHGKENWTQAEYLERKFNSSEFSKLRAGGAV